MGWWFEYVIIAVPLALDILAILIYRGAYRKGAILVSPVFLLVLGADGYSASQHGNLTGLITMIVGGPLLVVLLLLGIGNFASSAWQGHLREPGPTGLSDAKVLRFSLLGAIFGSIAGGLIFGGPAGFVANILGAAWGLVEPGWSSRWTIGNAAWYLGAIFGLVGGAVFALGRGLLRRS
jgi:hypothetical protein